MPLLNVGDPAPDFAVVGHTGETVKLSELAGRYVLLWFFPKAGTPACTTEGAGLRDRIGPLRDANVVVLGASVDTPDDNRAFADENDLPFVLLCDTTRSLSLKYGAVDDRAATQARRITYLIAPDGRIARVYAAVDPGAHPDAVLADLAAMGG